MFNFSSIKIPRIKQICFLFLNGNIKEAVEILTVDESEKNNAKRNYTRILKENLELKSQLKLEREKNNNFDEIRTQQNSVYEEKILKLKKENEASFEIQLKLGSEINILTLEIEKLKLELKYEDRKNKNNSLTSSLCPSGDVLEKAKPLGTYGSRVKSGKKPGGQIGHGSTRKTDFLKPNKIITHKGEKPMNIMGCVLMEDEKEQKYYAYQIQDIEWNTVVIEHRFYLNDFPTEKKAEEQVFKDEISISNPVVYGLNIKALAMLLNIQNCTSIGKVRETIYNLSGKKISLTDSTIVNFTKLFSEKNSVSNEKILSNILSSPTANIDETSIKVNGKNVWIFVIRYREYVYFRIYENRGDCGKGILEDYTGTIIHDHWISYYKFKKCRHAECNVHTNRVLNGLAILDKIELAFEFKKFMSSIDHERNDLIKNGIYSFSTERIKEIEDKYTESLINLGSYFEGLSENERKIYYKDGVNLVKRMLKYKENHLLFLHDFNVPFGNNDAERPLRHFKLKKQSMGSARSIIGSNNLITNMTAIKTEYFKTSNLLDFILESFIGKKIEVCTKEKTNSCDMAE